MSRRNIEETLKKKIQARVLIESGKCKTKQEVLKMTGIAKETLNSWMNEDPNDIWVFGGKVGENKIYDAQKIVQKEKILRQFKKEEAKIKDDIITRKATEDATQEAIVLVNLEKERNKLIRETLDNAYVINQYILDLVKKGRTAKMIEEDIIWEGKKIEGMKKQTKTVEEHKIPEVVRASEMIVKTLFGLGVLQTTPTVAIQNNNSAEAKVENISYTEQQEIKAKKLLASVIPQDE